MNDPIRKYLSGQSTLERGRLPSSSTEGIEKVVVIPSLAEDPGIFATLEDLSQNDSAETGLTLVIVVVNNRTVLHSSHQEVENNQRTMQKLAGFDSGLRLAVIDASSTGNELPDKEGVGLARKIGLDWGLKVLFENGFNQGALISLDADTRVESGYLTALSREFSAPDRWAGVIDYAHPIDDPSVEAAQRAAIVEYELFLRYHELGLAYAGSPYAFATIGSAMVCTGEAYAAVSGMKRTLAGEDFYFLQALAKTGPIRRIRGTTVHPSSRPSHRVPFGTGKTVRSLLDGEIPSVPFPHPELYLILKQWFLTVVTQLEAEGEQLFRSAGSIDTSLSDFLTEQDFVPAWNRIRSNAKTPPQRIAQFHRWFDAFRTLKLFHWLRDRGYPDVSATDAVGRLLSRVPDFDPIAAPPTPSEPGSGFDRTLLDLRRLTRNLPSQTSLFGHFAGLRTREPG